MVYQDQPPQAYQARNPLNGRPLYSDNTNYNDPIFGQNYKHFDRLENAGAASSNARNYQEQENQVCYTAQISLGFLIFSFLVCLVFLSHFCFLLPLVFIRNFCFKMCFNFTMQTNVLFLFCYTT